MSGLEELTREELIAIILGLQDKVAELEIEIERLRPQLPGGGAKVVPEWVKPNRKERREAERKKRQQSFVRRRDIATETHLHAVENCPKCGRELSGGWVHRRRQVIEIPDTPVRIIEHVIIARRCGVCGKRYVPKVDLSGQVVGILGRRFGRCWTAVGGCYTATCMGETKLKGGRTVHNQCACTAQNVIALLQWELYSPNAW